MLLKALAPYAPSWEVGSADEYMFVAWRSSPLPCEPLGKNAAKPTHFSRSSKKGVRWGSNSRGFLSGLFWERISLPTGPEGIKTIKFTPKCSQILKILELSYKLLEFIRNVSEILINY